jgi:TnpA family transposase
MRHIFSGFLARGAICFARPLNDPLADKAVQEIRGTPMPSRHILTERQRAALFDLPTTEVEMLHHYILADDNVEHIQDRRRPENRIGFALQLCVLRYPGRLLSQGEVIPDKLLRFIGAQSGITGEALIA